MSGPGIDIHYVAHLARISLSAEEEAHLGPQLAQILSYVEQLQRLEVTGIEPTAHAVPLANIVRPDQVQPSLPPEVALKNAPAQANGLFVVPKIVE